MRLLSFNIHLYLSGSMRFQVIPSNDIQKIRVWMRLNYENVNLSRLSSQHNHAHVHERGGAFYMIILMSMT